MGGDGGMSESDSSDISSRSRIPREWQQIAFYSVFVAGVILFGAWVYAFALLSLAMLMQLGWTMRGMLLL